MESMPVASEWVDIGSNTACDKNAGEVYSATSPGKGLSVDQCQQACEETAGCQSITYFNSGWCSHFSTPCTNTKRVRKAVAHRLSSNPGLVSATTGAFTS